MIRSRQAFSLVELLAVMAIMATFLALAGPAVVNLSRGQTITRASSDLPDLLTLARTHAMAHNTYVYAGFQNNTAGDEVFMAIVASKEGLSSGNGTLEKADLSPVNRLTSYKGVRLDTTAAMGALTANPPEQDDEEITTSTFTFQADAIRANLKGGELSDFTWVVAFDPSGSAKIQAGSLTVPRRITAGFVPATGNPHNAFCLQIDGPSGAVRTFRPNP